MQETIIKPGVVKRVVEKLNGTKINIGGNKKFYKREYNLKYSQEIVDNVIDAFMDVITDAIENGDSIKLNGYMVIEPKLYAETKARNVRENREIIIPEQYRVRIKPGSKFNQAVMRYTEKQLGKERFNETNK